MFVDVYGGGGYLAGKVNTVKRAHSTLVGACIVAALCIAAVAGVMMFVGSESAQGADKADSATLGIGTNRSTVDGDGGFDTASKLDTPEDGSAVSDSRASVQGTAVKASTGADLKTASMRTITVKDPDPVVALAAVDQEDTNTLAVAKTIGDADPLPTAPRLAVDTSGAGWQFGLASGYDVASSSTLTRSGRAFDDDCVTVAVPQGQEDLLGHPVEIVYEGQVVVATVTDTGGFAPYGRVLDLAGGVWKAFGCSTVQQWGVRTVSYRFL